MLLKSELWPRRFIYKHFSVDHEKNCPLILPKTENNPNHDGTSLPLHPTTISISLHNYVVLSHILENRSLAM